MSAVLTAPVDPAPMSTRLSGKRRAKDRAFTAFLWVCGVLAMLPLLFIAGYVVAKGVKALNKLEASGLIDELLEKYGCQRRNGGGRRQQATRGAAR